MLEKAVTHLRAEEAISDFVEQRMVLGGISWDQYLQIADAMYGCYVRLTYDRGALELVTGSPHHGLIAWLVAQFVYVLTEETKTRIRSCGRITIQAARLGRAIAPEESFYLTNEPAVRGRDDINFEVDPFPDLCIDVDFSQSAGQRMSVFAAMKVAEVWRISRDRGTIHWLAVDGTYQVAACSLYFAFVTPAALTDFVARSSSLDENSLMMSFREWVREQIR